MRIQLRNRFIIATPTPLAWRKAASGQPTCEVAPGSPESLARGMLSRGLPVNPGELPISHEQGAVLPNPKRTRSRGKRGCPTGSEQTLDVEYLLPRETGGGREGSAAVVRANSTDEGGEPQGFRQERPRDPPEGRGKQVGRIDAVPHTEAQNSRKYVQWNLVE